MDKQTATEILNRCNAANIDFHKMPWSDVCSLIDFADLHKYRKPKNANGSRARYFHAYLVRIANRGEK